MPHSCLMKYSFSFFIIRAVMTDGETIGPTQLVLEPANVTVHVARNLSPWYRDVPDIDVKGKLLAVKVSLLTNST